MNKFSDALICQIADAIGLTDVTKVQSLACRLRELADCVPLYQSWKLDTPPSHLEKVFKRIGRTTVELLECLGMKDDSTQPRDAMKSSAVLSILLYGVARQLDTVHPEGKIADGTADRTLSQIVSTIRAIKRAAQEAQDHSARQVNSAPGRPRHQPDRALHEVVWHLLRDYKELTGREPGASVDPDTQKIEGPTVRFLELTLRELGWPVNREAIRELIRVCQSGKPAGLGY